MKVDIIWFLNFQLFFYYALGTDCRREPRCEITRVHKMKAANCYGRVFYTFPKCVATDVEVIDLTFNRIRKISRSDFNRFSSLKFLYLADNLLSHLDGDVFEDIKGLTTLDLSLNAISKVPVTIFQLPSLRSLYLSQNLNINIVDALEMSRPIVSPLTQIDISKTTDVENYSDFPNFGILPFLTQLNITGNFYFTISPSFFMGFCNLQKIFNDNVTTEFDDPCDCWRLNYWLSEKNIKFTPFTCTVQQTKCVYKYLDQEQLEMHKQCKEIYETIQRNNTIVKVSIATGATFAVIFLLTGIIWIWYRRHRQKRNEKKKIKLSDNHSALLNGHNKSVPNEYT